MAVRNGSERGDIPHASVVIKPNRQRLPPTLARPCPSSFGVVSMASRLIALAPVSGQADLRPLPGARAIGRASIVTTPRMAEGRPRLGAADLACSSRLRAACHGSEDVRKLPDATGLARAHSVQSFESATPDANTTHRKQRRGRPFARF